MNKNYKKADQNILSGDKINRGWQTVNANRKNVRQMRFGALELVIKVARWH